MKLFYHSFFILFFSLLLCWDLNAQSLAVAGNTRAENGDTTVVYPQKEMVVEGKLFEEMPVGEYNQPEWTTQRRFPSTRVYVQTPPGSAEFEQWLEIREPKDENKSTETRLRQEFAFGIGNRLQLDIYLNTLHTRSEAQSTFGFRGWSAELRYALADWDVIPGNPTLYFEYLFFDGAPDKIEPKLLLGGELASRWHWGANFIYEGELAALADRDEEFSANIVTSYSLVDQKFSMGPSINFTSEMERNGGIDEHTTEFLIGASFQFHPVKRAYIDIEPLWGVTDESKKMKTFIVFGWEL